jgi:hypothetical protein
LLSRLGPVLQIHQSPSNQAEASPSRVGALVDHNISVCIIDDVWCTSVTIMMGEGYCKNFVCARPISVHHLKYLRGSRAKPLNTAEKVIASYRCSCNVVSCYKCSNALFESIHMCEFHFKGGALAH